MLCLIEFNGFLHLKQVYDLKQHFQVNKSLKIPAEFQNGHQNSKMAATDNE